MIHPKYVKSNSARDSRSPCINGRKKKVKEGRGGGRVHGKKAHGNQREGKYRQFESADYPPHEVRGSRTTRSLGAEENGTALERSTKISEMGTDVLNEEWEVMEAASSELNESIRMAGQ